MVDSRITIWLFVLSQKYLVVSCSRFRVLGNCLVMLNNEIFRPVEQGCGDGDERLMDCSHPFEGVSYPDNTFPPLEDDTFTLFVVSVLIRCVESVYAPLGHLCHQGRKLLQSHRHIVGIPPYKV